MFQAYTKIRKKIDHLLVWIKYYCVAVMLIMLALAFVQVIRRYAFNCPWSWSDEIILLFLAWFAYPAIVFNTWKDDHFYIGSLYDRFSPTLQNMADILRYIIQGVFLSLLAYYGMKLTQQYWYKPMPASSWSQGLKFIPVIIGGGLSTLFCFINLIGVFIKDDTEKGALDT